MSTCYNADGSVNYVKNGGVTFYKTEKEAREASDRRNNFAPARYANEYVKRCIRQGKVNTREDDLCHTSKTVYKKIQPTRVKPGVRYNYKDLK